MMPATLHGGMVAHIRHTPFKHRFSYRLWMMSVDLDRVGEVRSWCFGHNRARLVALYDRDHGPRDGSRLRPWVEDELRRAGLDQFAARIHLMAMPRVFGFTFNPIAFFFCYDAAGRLGAVVHQVKNTFGDQVAYVLPVADGSHIRQATDKRLHVSPFFDMAGGYQFAFNAPDFTPNGTPFRLAIRYATDAVPRLTATMDLAPIGFSTAALARLLITLPFVTMKVVAAIHWQAIRLWLRGARFHSRPIPAIIDPMRDHP
jgi:DUF1365 family protein